MKVASTTSKTEEIATASGSLEAVGIKQTLIKIRDYILCDRTQSLCTFCSWRKKRKVHFCRNTEESWKVL